MRFSRSLLSLLASLAISLPGIAHSEPVNGPELHAKVRELYSFQPHKLSDSEIQAKSDALDRFWSFVKANSGEALPLLRDELQNAENPNFFFYDGAKLLLSLSEDRSSRALALRAMAKVDLQDIDSTDYLRTVHSLARQGLDTREAALHVLDDPDFTAIIPLHALTLGQDFCLIYMLYAQTDVPFEADLVARLQSETRPTSQKSLLQALWYTVTPTGHQAIAKFIDRPDVTPEVAQYGRDLLARKAGLTLSLSSAATLRKERERVMQRPISDEALGEFDNLTRKLLAKL